MSEYLELLRDPAHWAFELTLVALIDGIIGVLVWPRIKRHIHRDVDRANHSDLSSYLIDDTDANLAVAMWGAGVGPRPPWYDEYERQLDLRNYLDSLKEDA